MKKRQLLTGLFISLALMLTITASVYSDDTDVITDDTQAEMVIQEIETSDGETSEGDLAGEEPDEEESEDTEQPSEEPEGEHVHEYILVESLEADCTEPGYKEYWTCSGCEKVFSDREGTEIDDLESWLSEGGEGYIATEGHDYHSQITETVTCLTSGVKTFTCQKCGDEYTEEIPAVGQHKFVKRVCSACGAKEDVIHRSEGGWYYVIDNVIQYDFTGIRPNKNGWWRIVNGKVDFSCNSVEKNENGLWYIKNGKVDFSYTGLAKVSNGWWKIVKGKVDINCNSVEKSSDGWIYFRNGRADFSYTGIAKNKYGWWRIVKGRVDFSCNSIEQNDYGWWYIKNGKVDFSYTGLAKSSSGWWRIVNGKVDFDCNSVEKNKYGWWKITNGKVDFSYTGVAQNKHGWWRIVKGKVDFKANGLFKGEKDWFYIKNGKADLSYCGFVVGKNGTWYVKNGKINFGYTGVVEDGSNSWYVNKGKLDRSFSGTVETNGIEYTVKNGLVCSPSSDYSVKTVFTSPVKNGQIHYGTSGDQYEIECVHACYCDVHSWTNPYSGHLGVDIICSRPGTQLLALASGTVVYVHHQAYENSGSYGSHPGEAVAVSFGDGLIYEYHELQSNSVKVKVGDKVNSGDVIGKVGMTGVTTGYHIHLSVLYWTGAEHGRDLSEMPEYNGPQTDGYQQINPLFFFGNTLAEQTVSWYSDNKYEWYGYKNAIPGDPRNYPVLAGKLK